MPSGRKQINVRVDSEAESLIRELIPAVSAAIGLPVSQSDLFRLGLMELKKKYLPGGAVTPPDAAKKTSAKKGKK